MPKGTVPPSGKATVDALADQWAKILSAYMIKTGVSHFVLTPGDVDKLSRNMENSIVVQELEDGLHVHYTDTQTAMKMAREHRTGFGKS